MWVRIGGHQSRGDDAGLQPLHWSHHVEKDAVNADGRVKGTDGENTDKDGYRQRKGHPGGVCFRHDSANRPQGFKAILFERLTGRPAQPAQASQEEGECQTGYLSTQYNREGRVSEEAEVELGDRNLGQTKNRKTEQSVYTTAGRAQVGVEDSRVNENQTVHYDKKQIRLKGWCQQCTA